MKLRLTSLLLLAATITLMSACTRDYTCRCGIKYTGKPGLPDSTTKDYTIKDTKSHAKELCEANSVDYTDADSVHTVENCYLY